MFQTVICYGSGFFSWKIKKSSGKLKKTGLDVRAGFCWNAFKLLKNF